MMEAAKDRMRNNVSDPLDQSKGASLPSETWVRTSL